MKEVLSLVVAVYATLLRAQMEGGDEVFPLDIVVPPVSQVVSGKQGTMTFFCAVKGEHMKWIIDGQIDDRVQFAKFPRVDGLLTGSITFPTTANFNATRVRCVAYNSSEALNSSEAAMIIAGPPLPPHPRLNMLSTTELEVSWDEPFTWEQFPVLNYTITEHINNSGSPPHTYTVTELSKLVTLQTEMTSCSVLSIRVSATNEIGVSRNGNVSRGFLVLSDNFALAPTVSTFTETSEVEISFTPPLVCSFQEAYYQVKVYSAGSGDLVYGEEFHHIDDDKVVKANIGSELQADAHYCAIITYATRDQFISVSANVSFMVGADLPSIRVERVTGEREPEVTLCVKLPVLCTFQKVSYKIIFSYQGEYVLEIQREFSYGSGYNSECIEELVTYGLQEGREYTVFVTMDTGQILNSSSVTLVPKLSCEDSEDVPWTSDTVVIAMGNVLVTVILILIAIIIIMCIALKHYRQYKTLAGRPTATNRVFEAYQLSFDGPIYHSIGQSTGHPNTGSLLEPPTNAEPLYHILEPTATNDTASLGHSLDSPIGHHPPHHRCKLGTLV